jgi:excisionase family DNA binding protein
MTEPNRDPLVEFARSLPAVLDDSALHELATRLRPFLLTELNIGDAAGERLDTTAEVAQQAHVNVETVRRAIRAGQLLVAARIGQSARLSQDAIDAWLAGNIEITDAGVRRRVRRRRSAALPEHSLRAAFKAAS